MRKVIRTLPGPASLNKATIPRKAKAAVAATSTSPVSVAATTELQRAEAHFALPIPASGKRPPFVFKVYKSADVKVLLFQDFFDKCAYCESRYATTAPVDVEHFRPKGRVKEDATHVGYWWLAMSWDNLLPACIFCNRYNQQVTPTPPKSPKTVGGSAVQVALDESSGKLNSSLILTTGKQDSFPVAKTRLTAQSVDYASEEALLLDPCRDNPEEHLHFHIDYNAPLGLVLPKSLAGVTTLGHLIPVKNSGKLADIIAHAATSGVSARGAVSIQTHGLNRLQLVRERTRVLRRLEFFEQLLVEITKLIADLTALPVHKDCKDRNERAVKSLNTMQSLITSQLREMTQPSAPYSAMVKAWVEDLRSRARLIAIAGGV